MINCISELPYKRKMKICIGALSNITQRITFIVLQISDSLPYYLLHDLIKHRCHRCVTLLSVRIAKMKDPIFAYLVYEVHSMIYMSYTIDIRDIYLYTYIMWTSWCTSYMYHRWHIRCGINRITTAWCIWHPWHDMRFTWHAKTYVHVCYDIHAIVYII